MSHKKKADCFVEHYAEVSWNNFTRDDGKTNRDAKKLLQIPTADGENSKDFSMKELKKTLKKMQRRVHQDRTTFLLYSLLSSDQRR